MALEDVVFTKKRVCFDKLISYGFSFDGEIYRYTESFLEDSFEARVSISKDGDLSACVIDLELDEEYLALRVERVVGSFVGQVREGYLEILERIAATCFETQPFSQEQTNRLAIYLTENFGDQTDSPFAKFPSFTAFRHPDNQKWYGLVGTVERSKLQLGEEEWSEEGLKEVVEIINIKVSPNDIPSLIEKTSIYPAYHMSKKSWVTVVLDGNVSDQELFELVINSRQLVAPKTVSNPNGTDYWIIPANMKNYDIDKDFAVSSQVYWHQKKSLKKGDIVLIYITAPTKAVRYICEVLKDNISDGDEKLMSIQLLKKLSDIELSLDLLKELGVTNIRGPRRLTASAISFIKKNILS
ncbi:MULTISPECIES: MmcQ/YjbR family DNA-binding protein [Streptococcus]|uniref:MmcQ/YjbR family DNA-binding protein n=1 Tax=Streptococcus caledonicus TaxID=2614158 RepID=A0ABW0UCL6_9STRE|nr:MmcQ/YjbR family DNA-binding protein [Streptococcus sp. S784/96/1]